MASTQTGTCLMVVALCFFLVLGSLVPCLPEFSSLSNTVKSPSPLPSADVYTASQVRSRSLLFFDESSPLEDGHGGFLKTEGGGWEGAPLDYTEDRSAGDGGEHETTKYLGQAHPDSVDYNRTGAQFLQEEPQYHKREPNPEGGAEYL